MKSDLRDTAERAWLSRPGLWYVGTMSEGKQPADRGPSFDPKPVNPWGGDRGPGTPQSSTDENLQPDGGEIFDAEVVGPSMRGPQRRLSYAARPRRTTLPIVLFAVTCVSTFWVGATRWRPLFYLQDMFSPVDWMPTRQTLLREWDTGLMYMTCVLAILLTHEMGHFVATLCHRIRASLPYFLPIPINPIGTLGAVIGMDGRSADRRQMFDIGIAGPIAGLVIAVPITWIGVQQLNLQAHPPGGNWYLDSPLAIRWMLDYHQPPGYEPGGGVWISQVNAYFMAGWIGMLITGLNMLPVSQLDGGHVMYTLFGKSAHWIARGFMVIAIAYVVYANVHIWALMIILVLLMGTDHPPTKDDSVPLGWFRTLLGYSSLLIPILCFPPRGLVPFSQALGANG